MLLVSQFHVRPILYQYVVGWLEFNVPFQHKYGYIRDEYEYLQKLITCEQTWCMHNCYVTNKLDIQLVTAVWDWETDRQWYPQTGWNIVILTDRLTERECYQQRDWHTVILTDRLRERESATYRQTDIQWYSQTDWQRDRVLPTERLDSIITTYSRWKQEYGTKRNHRRSAHQ